MRSALTRFKPAIRMSWISNAVACADKNEAAMTAAARLKSTVKLLFPKARRLGAE